MINLEELNSEDAYSLLFILMSKMSNQPPYTALSELSYVLDKQSFLNFITYYGGATIQVPTADEFHKAARVLVLYQSYICQKLSWKEALKISGYNEDESITAKMELQYFQKILSNKEKV